MASGATSQGVSGAAQGAVSGAMIGSVVPGIGTLVGGVGGAIIGGIGGLISGGSADAQQDTAMAWARYNNGMQYNANMYNIQSGLDIAKFNAAATMMAAKMQGQAEMAAAEYNAAMIASTTMYNNALTEQELSRLWEDMDLDLEQLELHRARERGAIVADQAASGTVIGEGSNEAVIVGQMTQEAMDATVIKHGADRQAANIMNQMSQNTWQGSVAIDQTIWEGQLKNYTTQANAAIQSASTLATARIGANADTWSANVAYNAGNNNIAIGNSKYSAQQTQNMVSGLFSAAATGATAYYGMKSPGTSMVSTSSGGGTTGPSGSLMR